jgi:sugar-specific transcriptional regulator TrmB
MINATSIQQRPFESREGRRDLEPFVAPESHSLSPSLASTRIDEEEIRALQLLRLTFYEAKAYRVLVKKGPLKASEVAFLSHVPRPKTYGALRLLEGKGLVHVVPSSPKIFSAVSPRAILKVKADELVNQAALTEEVVENLASEYALRKRGSGGVDLPREANELWQIDGREQIYHRVGQMLRSAVKSVSYCATPAGLVRAYKAHAKHMENSAKRHVNVRVLAQTAKECRMVARELSAIVRIRRTTKPFVTNFVCIDGDQLIVMENCPNDYDVRKGTETATWTTNKLLVESHESLFERIWDNASPI